MQQIQNRAEHERINYITNKRKIINESRAVLSSPNFAGGMQTPWRSRAEQEGGSDLTLSVLMMANTTMSRASVVDAKASACGASCWRSFFEPKDTEGSDWS